MQLSLLLLVVGEKMQLNIFEPRYRLLVRRCMEGNRRFGMATVNQLGQLSDIACQGEILECMPLPDGYDLPCCCISLFAYKPSRVTCMILTGPTILLHWT